MIGEWIANAWQAIVNNKDAVITFLTSAEFLALCFTVYKLIRNNRNTKKNTDSNSELGEKLDNAVTRIDTNTNTMDKYMELENKILKDLDTIKCSQIHANEQYNIFISKIDTMIESLRTLYGSTIKDLNLRNTVTSLLSTALHASVVVKAEILEELSRLKDEISSASDKGKDIVIETIDKLKESVKVESEVEEANKSLRY